MTTYVESNKDIIVANSDNWQYTTDSGLFEIIPAKHLESNKIVHVTIASHKKIWGLDSSGNIFKLISSSTDAKWIYFPVANGLLFIDIGSTNAGDLYGISTADRLLYRIKDREIAAAWGKVELMHENTLFEFEKVVPNDNQRLLQVTATSHYAIYALNEDGQVMYLDIPRFSNKIFRWQTFAGNVSFRKLAVGGAHTFRNTELWGLDASSQKPMRWIWSRGSWDSFNEPLLDVSITLDNAVYAVRESDGRLVKWNGAEQFIVQDQPMTTTGINRDMNNIYRKLTNVAALEEGKYVYGLDATTGDLLKMLM